MTPTPYFPTTRWSVVVKAGNSPTVLAQAAMEELCLAYRYPVYAYARRVGHTHEDAEDLVQGFFADFLGRRAFAAVTGPGGSARFRSFVLVCFNNFRRDEFDRATAEKRGGGQAHVSLDGLEFEQRYALEPADGSTPETDYDRKWALEIFDRAHVALREEYAARGNPVLFDRLQNCLQGRSSGSVYDAVAAELGKTEAAVKVEAFRMRRRFGELLRKVVADTVASLEEVEEELAYLVQILSRG